MCFLGVGAIVSDAARRLWPVHVDKRLTVTCTHPPGCVREVWEPAQSLLPNLHCTHMFGTHVYIV